MNTVFIGGYTWDWENMLATGEHGTYTFDLRWNDNTCNLDCRLIGKEFTTWEPISGYKKAIESYKNYVAEQVLLGKV